MKTGFKILLTFISFALIYSCNDDDFDYKFYTPSGNTITYDIGSKDISGISGSATFVENTDGSININLNISGTPAGGMHPAHIHFNTAAEGGDIAVTLGTVNGNTGSSTINITTLNDGSPVTYSDLVNLDGYINVHLSAEELGTIVAQGDIGQNDLNENSVTYDLGEKAVPGISGNIIFSERVNGEVLAEIMLNGTPAEGSHPAHIHENTAAEGGDILVSFAPINGDTGMSATNIDSYSYSEIQNIDGYVNVHLSADALGTIVAQGDIGQNDLNGNSITYNLGEKAVPGIAGNVIFSERVNGEVLAEIMLDGTPTGGVHPAHIHENTAAEGGGILVTFTPINGDTGMSATNIDTYTYSQIETIDGYVNVHLSASNLGTIVAQGDIGQNALTGNTKIYTLGEKAVAGISGNVIFSERINGEVLAEIMLDGTPAGGVHPAHIHENTAAQGGGILVTFTPINGDTGMSVTNIDTYTYSQIETIDGYVNVHLSASNLGTIVAQGDIGQNVLTGDSKSYSLLEKDVPGISGTATFYKRENGTALAILEVQNTPTGGVHPAHIHDNSAATGGGIAFTFNPVNGDTGMSTTQVESLNNSMAITYDEILTYNGYINVHLSATQLSTIVAQGNIGSNE